MPDISGSWMSGMLARSILVTMRLVGLGLEVFLIFTFGFLSFIQKPNYCAALLKLRLFTPAAAQASMTSMIR